MLWCKFNIKRKNKKYSFTQQTLFTWFPEIYIETIYPYFGCFGTICLIIGSACLYFSIIIDDFLFDYTHCLADNKTNNKSETCSSLLDSNYTSRYQTCTCKIELNLTRSLKGQVYFYYMLDNFHSNHRRFYNSRDPFQLAVRPHSKLSEKCEPFRYFHKNQTVYFYAPCGLVANSLFNDSFQLIFINGNMSIPVRMINKGIAWPSEMKVNYGKETSWENTVKPDSWKYSAVERSNESYRDEELIVWMRTSAFPSFKKFKHIILHDMFPFKDGLPKGKYLLEIDYAYPTTIFNGRKMIYLSTTSFLGGKNNNLGIMFISLGLLYELLALSFFIFTFYEDKRFFQDSDDSISTSLMTPLRYISE